jgi:hypothetical protein
MVFRTGKNEHLADQMENKISFNLNHLLWEC